MCIVWSIHCMYISVCFIVYNIMCLLTVCIVYRYMYMCVCYFLFHIILYCCFLTFACYCLCLCLCFCVFCRTLLFILHNVHFNMCSSPSLSPLSLSLSLSLSFSFYSDISFLILLESYRMSRIF